MKHDEEALTRQREEAWVGDAVLALYVRERILREEGFLDGEMFTRFTSNDFLRAAGNPTRVEAEIGRVYKRDGLAAAYALIEKHLLPLFEAQEKTRRRQLGGRRPKG
ncbi:MAG: hypothetical protein HKN82_14030 [Akkermansiaceae bacterium]|nr:hypothetical protein [Akkermansiaceae bacterium]